MLDPRYYPVQHTAENFQPADPERLPDPPASRLLGRLRHRPWDREPSLVPTRTLLQGTYEARAPPKGKVRPTYAATVGGGGALSSRPRPTGSVDLGVSQHPPAVCHACVSASHGAAIYQIGDELVAVDPRSAIPEGFIRWGRPSEAENFQLTITTLPVSSFRRRNIPSPVLIGMRMCRSPALVRGYDRLLGRHTP